MALDYERLGLFYLGRARGEDGEPSRAPFLYDAKDLTTHAVCVGMTGSGKTGLCLGLLEEAAIDGIPAICIDPKGDLGNLLLAFPDLAPADFEPWVDAAAAGRKELSVPDYAARVAADWKQGLADWDQPPERIARFRDAAEVSIYTPGSDDGLPLSVLSSFAAPTSGDAEATRERAAALASGLLCLLGRDADPLQSREHILLATLLTHAWAEGTPTDLAALVAAVQNPPLERVGALDLETFFPARERLALALALNNLLASPGFAAWTRGTPLDIAQLLHTPAGKPRIAIISIAHLSDVERMFVVTLVLNELVAWMRRQQGTSSLRAIFYMDEIYGYFPPGANPPSKPPMLTLLKQARAYGLGCALSTQNPVDLDYKGLSNAGTWLVGRLSTERDKARLLDGLEASHTGTGLSRAEISDLLSGLPGRTFFVRNVHESAPAIVQSRWALSYLRGPLTGTEISRLMEPRKRELAVAAADDAATIPASTTATAGTTAATVTSAPAATRIARPALPAGVRERFAGAGATGEQWRAGVCATAKLHFVDRKLGVDAWRTYACSAPLDANGDVLWHEGATIAHDAADWVAEPSSDASFGELPAAALNAKSYAAWSKRLAASLYETCRLEIEACDELDLAADAGEAPAAFRARVAHKAREQRDEALEKLRRKHEPRRRQLEDQLRRAVERGERERSQLAERKMGSLVSIGSAVLGALLGSRRVTATTIGRAATAARSAGRIGRERDDVERADETIERLRARIEEFEADCASELDAIAASVHPDTLTLRVVAITPRKTDIAVSDVGILWS